MSDKIICDITGIINAQNGNLCFKVEMPKIHIERLNKIKEMITYVFATESDLDVRWHHGIFDKPDYQPLHNDIQNNKIGENK